LQETGIDGNRRGEKSEAGSVPEPLGGGKLGPQRKLYCREIIARFGHELALNRRLIVAGESAVGIRSGLGGFGALNGSTSLCRCKMLPLL
jgi:hypothetical protein